MTTTQINPAPAIPGAIYTDLDILLKLQKIPAEYKTALSLYRGGIPVDVEHLKVAVMYAMRCSATSAGQSRAAPAYRGRRAGVSPHPAEHRLRAAHRGRRLRRAAVNGRSRPRALARDLNPSQHNQKEHHMKKLVIGVVGILAMFGSLITPAPAQADAIFTAYFTAETTSTTCKASFVITNQTDQARQVFFERSYTNPNGGGAGGDAAVYGFAPGQTRTLSSQVADSGAVIVLKAWRGDSRNPNTLIRQQTFNCPNF